MKKSYEEVKEQVLESLKPSSSNPSPAVDVVGFKKLIEEMVELCPNEDGPVKKDLFGLLTNNYLKAEHFKIILDELEVNNFLEQCKEPCKVLLYAVNNPDLLKAILDKLNEQEVLELCKIESDNKNFWGLAAAHTSRFIESSGSFSMPLLFVVEKLTPANLWDLVQWEAKERDSLVLHIAAEKGNTTMLEFILNKLPQEKLIDVISLKNKDGVTLLKSAEGKPESIKIIKEKLLDSMKELKIEDNVKLKLVAKLYDLKQRKDEYSNYGIFKYTGAYSKTEKINAISKFLRNETLDRGDIGALLEGGTGSMIKSSPMSSGIISQATSSLGKN